jgi:hypothetical protein
MFATKVDLLGTLNKLGTSVGNLKQTRNSIKVNDVIAAKPGNSKTI